MKSKNNEHLDNGINAKTLGRNIEYYRLLRGFSVQGLANAVHVHFSSIRNYETGKYKPVLSTLKHIAEALRVDTAELMFGDKQMERTVKVKPSVLDTKIVIQKSEQSVKAVAFKIPTKDFIALRKLAKRTGKTYSAMFCEYIQTKSEQLENAKNGNENDFVCQKTANETEKSAVKPTFSSFVYPKITNLRYNPWARKMVGRR